MGLDMYLSAKLYLSSRHGSEDEKRLFSAINEIMKLDLSKDISSGNVSLTVGYWRKANAIHNWFVQNVQKGEDNCASYYVSRERLKELLSLCESVLNNKSERFVSETLPPTSGFFFGSIEIDEYYFNDIENTIKIIKMCLSPKFEGWDFYYQSSW